MMGGSGTWLLVCNKAACTYYHASPIEFDTITPWSNSLTVRNSQDLPGNSRTARRDSRATISAVMIIRLAHGTSSNLSFMAFHTVFIVSYVQSLRFLYKQLGGGTSRSTHVNGIGRHYRAPANHPRLNMRLNKQTGPQASF